MYFAPTPGLGAKYMWGGTANTQAEIEPTYMNYKISLPKNQIILSNYNSLLRDSGFILKM